MKIKLFSLFLFLMFFGVANQNIFACADTIVAPFLNAKKYDDARKYLEANFVKVSVWKGDVCAHGWLAMARRLKGQDFVEEFEKGIAGWVPTDLKDAANKDAVGLFLDYALANLAVGEKEMKAGNLEKAYPYLLKARVWAFAHNPKGEKTSLASQLLAQYWLKKDNYQMAIFYCDEAIKGATTEIISKIINPMRNAARDKQEVLFNNFLLENFQSRPPFFANNLVQINVLYPVVRDLNDTLDDESKDLIILGKYSEALEHLTEKLQMLSYDNNNERAWYYYWRSRLNAALLKPVEALNDFNQAAKLPGLRRIVTEKTVNQVSAYQSALRLDVARHHLYQLEFDEARKHFNSLMDAIVAKKVKAQDGEVFLIADGMGDLSAKDGKFDTAKKVYEIGDSTIKAGLLKKAAELVREKDTQALNADGTVNVNKRVKAFEGQALEFVRLGKYEEAIGKLSEIISLKPDSESYLNKTYETRADLYRTLGDKNGSSQYLESAMADYNRCCGANYKASDSFYANRGSVLRKLKKYQEAYNDYVKFNQQPNASHFDVLIILKEISLEASRAGFSLKLDSVAESDAKRYASEKAQKLASDYIGKARLNSDGKLDNSPKVELFDGLNKVLEIDPGNQRALDRITELRRDLGVKDSISSAEFRKFLVAYAANYNTLESLSTRLGSDLSEVDKQISYAQSNIAGTSGSELHFSCSLITARVKEFKRISESFVYLPATPDRIVEMIRSYAASIPAINARISSCNNVIRRVEENRRYNQDCMSGKIYCGN